MLEANYILQAIGICKSFPGIKVLDGAELKILAGEVHALMGENGAGKSTLMKIIMGIYKKDEGQIFFNGNEMNFKKPKDALEAGISMIHQELAPIPEMTVAENVFLGRESKKIKGLPFVDKNLLNKKTQDLLEEYELSTFIKPNMKMKELNIAQIQMMEIIKAVSYNSKVIIMDEPTSSLSDKESKVLYKIIDILKKKKVGIVYISHRMEEVFQLADRVSVLRDGKFIGCEKVSETTSEHLINMMVGRELSGGYPENTAKIGDVILEVKNLNRKNVFQDISFSVRAGEIVGMAGLVGAGRSEVVQALVGYDKLDSGTVIMQGKEIKIKHPSDSKKNHIILAPEDRKLTGLMLCRSIKENTSIQNMDKITKGLFLHKKQEKKICIDINRQMTTKMTSINDAVYSLSGGNQQKVVLCRCILAEPKILILDEPTRGIDVGAKAAIYEIMIELAKQGMGIIMISSEMPELIGMSTRVIVMSRGKITATLEGEDAKSQHKILSYALGGE